MDILKYIVDEYNNISIFSPTATHSDVARTMHGKPVGAGFVSINLGGANLLKLGTEPSIKCYGESISLNIKSRKEKDEQAILKAINS